MTHTANELLRSALTRDDQLDDLARVRIWSRIASRLAEPEARSARWPLFAGIAIGACAAAAAALFVLRPHGDQPHAVEQLALTAPAHATVSARLGPHTQAALVGPAHLAVVGEAGDRTTVRLDAGTLYASFDGGAGRSLRIVAPGATVEVVGTLFAVEVAGDRTCVSVAHGRVRVTPKTGTIRAVGAGERVCGDAADRIDPALHEALVHFETPEPPAVAPAPVVTPLPPPPPAPVVAPPAEEHLTQTAPKHPTPAPKHVDARHVEAHAPTEHVAPTEPARSEPRSEPPRSEPPAEPAKPEPPRPEPAKPVVRPSSEELYRAAEAALARRDADTADRVLAQLLSDYPGSPLVDEALYERAHIAYQKRAWTAARHHLERLAMIAHSPLAEPGQYLACRIAVETHDQDAVRCLNEYRAKYPGSPHDQEALRMLGALAKDKP